MNYSTVGQRKPQKPVISLLLFLASIVVSEIGHSLYHSNSLEIDQQLRPHKMNPNYFSDLLT